MLDSLRAFSKTWVAKILFGILIISFGAFGISNVIFDLGTNTVARVGDQDITLRDYQRTYQTQLNNAARQFGAVPTTEQALAMGLPGSALSQLTADAAINQLAVSLGLGASDARLAKMLREDPSFAGTLGTFDSSNFTRVLQQVGYTESEYFDVQTRAARRQQIAAGLFADVAVPQAAIDLVSRFADDKRTINYIVLNAASVQGVPEPTDAELQEYLTAHQAEYRTTATREVDVLLLTPDTIAPSMTPAEDAIAAEYERTKASLTRPERRTIVQLVLADDAMRAKFEEGKAAGKSLDVVAAENGLSPAALGTLSKAEITDLNLATAAYSLAPGDFSIIPGVAGPRAVAVTAIEPGGTPSLDDVRDQIAAKLAQTSARNGIADILDQVEELRAALKPLDEIAERFNLPLAHVTLAADGAALADVPGLAEADRAQVAKAIFNAEVKKLAPTLSLGANRSLLFDVQSDEAARDQTITEVHEQVLAAWTDEKTDAAQAVEAQRLVDMLTAGQSFDEVAAEVSLFPSVSAPIPRSGDGSPILDASVGAAAFAGGDGHAGSAKNGDGDYVVFQVVDTSPAEVNAQARTFVENAVRDTLFSEFVIGVRQGYGVHQNDAAVAQLLAGQ